ncbi:anthranilate synthase component I family protein [Limibacter armeniacum]|uniref:anthranilate synthase component I family protein n=1 Tax=Limibacter armeniacum TaxID=466084 RepID=UPI002FE501B3
MVTCNNFREETVLKSYVPEDMETFRQKALVWASQFEVFTWLDNNEIAYPEGGFQNLLAVGAKEVCQLRAGNTFEGLQAFHDENKDWMFGFMTYDLKNEVEALTSENPDGVDMPMAFFYKPIYLLRFTDNMVEILKSEEGDQLINTIEQCSLPEIHHTKGVSVQQKIEREKYIETVETIRQHIVEGDVYEMNFCMEFFAEQIDENPLSLFLQLNKVSPMPFAAFHRLNDKYLISASPERFVRKEGTRLLSQPIKGTIRRGQTPEEDKQLQDQLRNDEKEIAENMMIVDLVRNDLARSCETGSVKVPEIFGIYGFRQVHQMISTIEGQLREEVPFGKALKHLFPMGSMTGAPKVKSMELIERYEQSRRGLYSGTVGYITPEGDFDFNVIIRSMLYNASCQYLSFQIGSAITIDSVPEKEYEECLLKAKAIRSVLGAI